MFTNIFLKVINNIWPMLFIFTIVIISIRLTYLIYNKQKIILYKEILSFCFIIYLLLLYYIVTFQDNNYGTNNFVPFREIFRYDVTSSLFVKNVLGNIILFIPFGLFVTYYIKNKSIYITLFLSILVSGAIEFAQSCIGRTADIDDVILNTIGGFVGFFICRCGNSFTNKLPKVFKSQLFLDILSLIFIFIIIYLMFKFNFWGIIK